MQPPIDAFLDLVTSVAPVHYYWWIKGDTKRTVWWNGEGRPAVPEIPGANIYIGVHGCSAIPPTDARGKPTAAAHVRAQLQYIAGASCAFAEFDAKDYGSLQTTLAHIRSLDPLPSALIESGGGYHAYWFFAEPYVVDSDTARDQLRVFQRNWVASVGGDDGSKDLCRVLRVPGTLNYKYDPPREVKLLVFEPTRRYAFVDLWRRSRPLEQPVKKGPYVDRSKPQTTKQATNRRDVYTAATLKGVLRDLAQSVANKNRNTNLNKAAYRLGMFVGHGLIAEREAEQTLLDAGAQLGLPKNETGPTVASGLAAGIRDCADLNLPSATEPTPLTAAAINDIFANEIGADDLKRKTFPKQIWPVETILSPGVTLLAGPPKSGKSWLALQIGIEVARGGVVLGRFETNQGRVLYLDLESSQRRMRDRLEDLLGTSAEWPSQFRLLDSFPSQPHTTVLLREWLERHRDARLIVIDILKKIRAPQTKNASVYNEDYEAIQPLNALAEEFQVAILILHHINKIRNAENAFDRINGSNGLAGATSNNMVLLKTGQEGDEFTLHLQGRDYDGSEDSLGLRWDREIVRHIYAGTAEAVMASAERKEVMACFKSDDDVLSIAAIAAMIGKSKPATWKLVRSCQTAGLLEKVAHGKYARIVDRG